MKKLGLLLFISIIMLSCETVNSIASKLGKKQPTAANTEWILVHSNLNSEKTPTLILETNRVSGTGGCNNYFAELSITPETGSISIKNLGSTRMACENMMSESTYFNLLQKVNKYILTEESLELYQDNLLLLKYKKM